MAMKIETIEIAKLRFDPKNARKHGKKNLDAIAGSLESFGQRKPIVIDSNNVIVAGNGTAEAARFLGWIKIDCVRVPDDWAEDEVKAFALADNRTSELAEWDKDVLAKQLLDLQEIGFDVSLIGFDGVEESVADFEAVEELPRLDQKAKTVCPNCKHEF